MIMEKICPRCGTTFTAKKTGKGYRTYCNNVCAAKEHNKRHGLCLTREYKCWELLRDRVNNPNHHAWARYGGRGIAICDRWNLFENFLADMGPKPGPEYSIDRIDNDGNYEPGNCRWATKTEQSRNRSSVVPKDVDQKIRYGVAQGMNFAQIARSTGRSVGSIRARAYRVGLKSGQSVLTQQRDTEEKT